MMRMTTMSKFKLEFDEEKHIYRANGVIVPSVTEILKFLSVDTSANASPYLRQQAADRGTRIHEATIIYDYAGMDDELIDADIYPYIKAYADFVRDYRIRGYLLTEHALTNGEYAGTLDRLAVIDGKITVIDFKTGTTVDKLKEAAQLYAYAKLLADNEMYRDRYGDFGAFVLRLKRDGTYTVQERNIYRGKVFFEKCKELYQLIKEEKNYGN
jgi:hypothetical protein